MAPVHFVLIIWIIIITLVGTLVTSKIHLMFPRLDTKTKNLLIIHFPKKERMHNPQNRNLPKDHNIVSFPERSGHGDEEV